MIATRRAYAIIFALVVAFILYGSLYPFRFHARPENAFAYLLSTWGDWDHVADLTANILLYMPLGFFGVCAFRPRVLWVILAGALLSTGVELTQFYDLGRTTSLGDVYANTIGTACGALIALAIGGGLRWPLVRELFADPPAALLLAMWFGYRAYPYVPVIKVRKYIHALAAPAFAPMPAAMDVAEFGAAWLAVAAILSALYGTRRALTLFVLIAGLEFAARVMIIDDTLQLADLIGTIVALVLWFRWLPARGRFTFVTLAFAAMIVGTRLAPFTFGPVPHEFGWAPFASFMRGSTGVAIQAFCEKFFQYGTLIWLLCYLGVRLDIATILSAGLLFATSWSERYLPGRSAEITDAAMALTIGGAFALLRDGPVPLLNRPGGRADIQFASKAE